MKKKSIIVLVIPVVILVLAIAAFRSGWIMQSADTRREALINRSCLQGIANGIAAAGILPPESGYKNSTHENGELFRLRYVNGKPSVISPGGDGEFGTEHDIVIHYHINKTAHKPSHCTADNRPGAYSCDP